jgi:hypothetical protein
LLLAPWLPIEGEFDKLGRIALILKRHNARELCPVVNKKQSDPRLESNFRWIFFRQSRSDRFDVVSLNLCFTLLSLGLFFSCRLVSRAFSDFPGTQQKLTKYDRSRNSRESARCCVSLIPFKLQQCLTTAASTARRPTSQWLTKAPSKRATPNSCCLAIPVRFCGIFCYFFVVVVVAHLDLCAGVGKTSVVLRYVQGVYSLDQPSTIGASFMTKRMYVLVVVAVLDFSTASFRSTTRRDVFFFFFFRLG